MTASTRGRKPKVITSSPAAEIPSSGYRALKAVPQAQPQMVALVEHIEDNELFHLVQFERQRLEQQYLAALRAKDREIMILKQDLHREREHALSLRQLILTPVVKPTTPVIPNFRLTKPSYPDTKPAYPEANPCFEDKPSCLDANTSCPDAKPCPEVSPSCPEANTSYPDVDCCHETQPCPEANTSCPEATTSTSSSAP